MSTSFHVCLETLFIYLLGFTIVWWHHRGSEVCQCILYIHGTATHSFYYSTPVPSEISTLVVSRHPSSSRLRCIYTSPHQSKPLDAEIPSLITTRTSSPSCTSFLSFLVFTFGHYCRFAICVVFLNEAIRNSCYTSRELYSSYVTSCPTREIKLASTGGADFQHWSIRKYDFLLVRLSKISQFTRNISERTSPFNRTDFTLPSGIRISFDPSLKWRSVWPLANSNTSSPSG